MIICHNCAHEIEVYSNITTIRCSKCRATYVSGAVKTPPPEKENDTSPESVADTSSRRDYYGYELEEESDSIDKTTVYPYSFGEKPPQPASQVGLRDWGIFDVIFLEKIKASALPRTYQLEIINKRKQNIALLPIVRINKEKVVIGRKPASPNGFEDVDMKLESQDSSLSRRQCELEIKSPGNQLLISLTTHANAANPVEVNGKTLEKNNSKVVHHGDFLRLGNTIFEIVVDNQTTGNEPIDYNKTVIF